MSTAEEHPESQQDYGTAAEAARQSDKPPVAGAVTDERFKELRQLFNGVAVVIDDQVEEPGTEIAAIVRQIHDGGGKVIAMTDLPHRDYDFSNFTGVSFFILDWQLHQTLAADGADLAQVRYSEAFLRNELHRKILFLKRIMEHRLAPVFIFTTSDLDAVKEALLDAELYADGDHSHIMVSAKSDVIHRRVFDVLVHWIHERPSAYVLKTWEREYEKAKNAMFKDLYTKSVDWPVLLWKTFRHDDLPASDELGRLITRIIFSRMTPFHLDLEQFVGNEAPQDEAATTEYRKKLLAVMEAERFVPVDGLHEDSIAPGDVFKMPQGKYLINIRPDCDCIVRAGNEALELYLLEGSVLTSGQLPEMLDLGRGVLQEGDAQVAVFGMYKERTIVFNMKELTKKPWSELKARRIGRLLPPYLTRLQQRYASYLQRPGLSRIPLEALTPQVVEAARSKRASVGTSAKAAASHPEPAPPPA